MMDVYFSHRLIAIIKFKDWIKTNIVSIQQIYNHSVCL